MGDFLGGGADSVMPIIAAVDKTQIRDTIVVDLLPFALDSIKKM